MYLCIYINTNNKKYHTECVLWCRMLTNPNMHIVGNQRLSTFIYPLLITRGEKFVVFVNCSPQTDWSNDVWIKGVVWNWYRISIINKSIVLYYFVFFFCNAPTNREIWVTHWANIINSIDPTMMSEEYPIMIILGLPIILICEIMTTIKTKIIHVNNIGQIGNVELN